MVADHTGGVTSPTFSFRCLDNLLRNMSAGTSCGVGNYFALLALNGSSEFRRNHISFGRLRFRRLLIEGEGSASGINEC